MGLSGEKRGDISREGRGKELIGRLAGLASSRELGGHPCLEIRAHRSSAGGAHLMWTKSHPRHSACGLSLLGDKPGSRGSPFGHSLDKGSDN